MDVRQQKLVDEYIEALWILQERGDCSTRSLREYFGKNYNEKMLDIMQSEGIAAFGRGSDQKLNAEDVDLTIVFTETGRIKGRKMIRAHRLAERLLYDVLKIENYEFAACEFEHIIDTDLIDAICTLLGHPRRCPDGLPIPDGVCCRAEQKTIRSPSLSLLELRPEESGRVTAVHSESDHQLHLLDVLQIRPGSIVRVHQINPSIVVECDGSNIAIDEDIAGSIFVWRINDKEAWEFVKGLHQVSDERDRGGRVRVRRGKGDRRESNQPYDCGPRNLYGDSPGEEKSRRGRFHKFWGRKK
ncbi:MAG: metal-dependent transcriptional regulator [Spirochaetales bacterium]|jgi:DtxR family Mn-dependent transcriptional regulator|nr:metal-dependent transcriptional regulator [Spirochaetales bacterium]